MHSRYILSVRYGLVLSKVVGFVSNTSLGGPILFHVPWAGSRTFFGPLVCSVHVLRIQHMFGLGVSQARGTDMYCGNDRVYKVWRAWRKWVLRICTWLKWSG